MTHVRLGEVNGAGLGTIGVLECVSIVDRNDSRRIVDDFWSTKSMRLLQKELYFRYVVSIPESLKPRFGLSPYPNHVVAYRATHLKILFDFEVHNFIIQLNTVLILK